MLKTGDPAPSFELEDAQGQTWTLEKLSGQKFILYFYPADDTPGCTKESCDFRDAQPDFDKAGYAIFGVSPQGATSHERFSRKYELNFPLLIDSEYEAAKAFGVAEERGEGKKPRIKRSTFVIDEEGAIAEALYGVTAKTHVGELKDQLIA